MKKIFFYFLIIVGAALLVSGLYYTYYTYQKYEAYWSLKEKGVVALSPYGSIKDSSWFEFIIAAAISLIGWCFIYYSDKSLNNRKWINEEYAPFVPIILVILPAYFIFFN